MYVREGFGGKIHEFYPYSYLCSPLVSTHYLRTAHVVPLLCKDSAICQLLVVRRADDLLLGLRLVALIYKHTARLIQRITGNLLRKKTCYKQSQTKLQNTTSCSSMFWRQTGLELAATICLLGAIYRVAGAAGDMTAVRHRHTIVYFKAQCSRRYRPQQVYCNPIEILENSRLYPDSQYRQIKPARATSHLKQFPNQRFLQGPSGVQGVIGLSRRKWPGPQVPGGRGSPGGSRGVQAPVHATLGSRA